MSPQSPSKPIPVDVRRSSTPGSQLTEAEAKKLVDEDIKTDEVTYQSDKYTFLFLHRIYVLK